jgi:hypothetical protein
MDRPLSQLIAPELIFERPEEGPRCGKQRIVFLKPAKYSIGFPCSLYPGMRCPTPSTASGTALLIAARTCWSLCRTASDWAAMYSSTDLGTHFVVSVILWFGMRLLLADSTSSGDRFLNAPSMLLFRVPLRGRRQETFVRSWRLCTYAGIGPKRVLGIVSERSTIR